MMKYIFTLVLQNMFNRFQQLLVPLRITAAYLIIASLWILFSDSILHGIGIDEVLIPGLSIIKGIAFVLFTSLILFMTLQREFRYRSRLEDDLREQIQRVEQSEERFRKAIEEAPQPISIYAEDGEILTISRTWLEITGYTRQQLATIETWSELAYGERKQPIKEGIDRLFNLDGRTDEGQFTIRCADGSERNWLFSSTPLGRLPDGRRIVMSIATDVTKHLITQQQLLVMDSAIEATLTPIALADLQGYLTYVNPAFVKMWQLEGNAQAVGRSVLEFWDSPEAAQKIVQEIAEQDDYVGELTAKLADGTTAKVELVASLVRDGQGKPIAMIGSFKDVTKQREAAAIERENERLSEQFQKEHERNALVMRIVSALSHDLRTPLTVISTSKDMLLTYYDRLSEEKRHEKLKDIERQVQFALDLLTDTVNMARGNLTDGEFQPKPVNIEVLCQVSVEQLQASAETEISLRFVNHTNTTVALLDEVLVSRILLNLLSNAIKYSPVDEEVRLELDATEEWVILRVSDQGRGIHEEDVPHIFDPFFRSDDVREIDGTGLGLSIVKDCVERHEGQIHVQSVVGSGSTFTVKLPLQRL